MTRRLLLPVLALLLTHFPASAQAPGEPLGVPARPYVAAPAPALPPLMYLRLDGPRGMKVTVFRGGQRGTPLEAPVTLGLRPGYGYRLALSDIPELPGQVFYPTVEVRGTLLLSPHVRHADFPATLNFNLDELARVHGGAMLKKVIVVERPDRAIPTASRPDEPIEVPIVAPRDPLVEGRELGQPLVVLHLGQRQFGAEELRYQGVPGTVLLPGEKVLGMPPVAPWIVWHWCPVYDPILGGEHPANFNVVPDGGDTGLPVGMDRTGKLRGLDPSDTVAEYVDGRGRKRLAVSNRVELCIPRFVVFRSELLLAEQVARLGPGNAQVTTAQGLFTGRQGLQRDTQRLQPEGVAQQQRLAGAEFTFGTAIVGRMQGLEFTTTLRGTDVVDGVCQRPEVDRPEVPLLIIKFPDKCGALVGDVVTFTLKYTNRGPRPVSDIAVTDNLTARFEYVRNSSRTDRPASFTTRGNSAGSTELRWEFADPLPPGESGVVTFQVKVR